MDQKFNGKVNYNYIDRLLPLGSPSVRQSIHNYIHMYIYVCIYVYREWKKDVVWCWLKREKALFSNLRAQNFLSLSYCYIISFSFFCFSPLCSYKFNLLFSPFN